jgi:alkyldihydroxyacetonephosphate synthase
MNDSRFGPSRTERVHDLWPLGLLRSRAGQHPPEVDVVQPASLGEITHLMRGGRRIIPAGGRSGVCGALAPQPGDLVLDLTALTEVEVDAANLKVRAQAGVNGLKLEQTLNEKGLTLGHFPASLSSATVGGLLSTRSSGQESTMYGSVEDMVMGLTMVLPNGQVVEAKPHPRSAVPALDQIFLGAEGGLGVIVEAVLRVHRQPELVAGRSWRFEDINAGLEAMQEVMQKGLRPMVLRLYDPEDSIFQGLDDGCLLLGASAGPALVAQAEAETLSRIVATRGGAPLGEEPWTRWLKHRFDLSASRLTDLLSPPGAFLDTIELATSWTSLAALYAEVKDQLTGTGLAMCHFSHAYPQGCCAYFTFAGSAQDEEGARSAYEKAWREVMEIALRHRATITHHHGVGLARAEWIRAELGGWWQVWELVRSALDPNRRMNPNALGGV